MNSFLDYCVYLLVRVFICVIQSLDFESCRVIAKGLAVLAAGTIGIRRDLVEENLKHSFPQWTEEQRRDLTRRMWEHLFLLVAEVAHCPRKIRETNWRKHIQLDQVESIHQLLCVDRPLILVTGHFGNFEIGGYLLGLLGYPSFTVARKLDNPYLNNFVERFRGMTGQFILSKHDGPDPIIEVLERNDTMAFLADQSAGRRGCRVEFFQRPASAYKAIALLSLQYNAPIAVCYATRNRSEKPLTFEMHVAGVYDPLNPTPGLDDVKRLTQWYTTLLEEGIRRYPDQYWWIHNRWKSVGR